MCDVVDVVDVVSHTSPSVAGPVGGMLRSEVTRTLIKRERETQPLCLSMCGYVLLCVSG